MIVKFARYRVRSDAVPKALALVRAFVDEVARKEGGTARYDAYQHAEDASRFTHHMAFRTPAAEDYHRKTAWCKRFVEGLYPLCVEEPVFETVVPVESA